MARDYQTKANLGALPDTITATRFGAGEFNSIAVELENAVTTSDQTLAPADGTGEVTDQLAMALAIYGAGGAFYHADTGAVNAYVLTPISPKESPPAYFDGFTVIFEAGTVNTTASTVNVNSLGVKNITYSDGNALVGGELSGSCGIKYNLSDDRFELLFSSGALAGLSPVYVIDASQADQGAASTNANTYTVFDAAAAIGTTKNATLYFPHNPVAGNQTLFTFDTSLDLTSYPNLSLKMDQGAQFDRTTGDEVLTIYSPENLSIGDSQEITSVNMLAFANSGTVYADWWGAKADGSTESIDAINWALSSASSVTVKLLSGEYVGTDDTIIIPTGCILSGQGKDNTTIKALSLGDSTPLVSNETTGSYTDIDIKLKGIAFDGDGAGNGGAQSRLTEMLSFSRVTGLTIDDCKITNVGYIGCAIGGGIDSSITDSEFTLCGFDGTTSNGGAALWCATVGTDPPENIRIENCHIHDNEWIGTHVSAIGSNIVGNHYENNKETNIYSSHLPSSNIYSMNQVISSNVLIGVTKKDISSHGIEIGTLNFTITGNMIYTCDHGGIALTDCQQGVVSGNSIGNFDQLSASTSGIDIISTSASPDQPQNISITGNTIFDDQSTPTGYAAISIGGSGAGVGVVNIIITDNSVESAWVSGTAIIKSATYWDGNSYQKNNAGAGDEQPISGQLSLTAATGSVSVTGIPFTPHRIEARAYYPSTLGMYKSFGEAVFGTAEKCATTTADGTGNLTVLGSHLVDLRDGSNTSFMVVDVTSIDFDGFTLNKTTATLACTLNWVAFP